MDLNRITLMGRLVAEPEYGMSQSGTAYCRIRIAVNRFSKTGEEPQADFFNCISFNKTADFIQKYFAKGKKILVDGNMQNNDYLDKNGTKHYSMNVIVRDVYFCDNSGNLSATPPSQQNKAPQNYYQQPRQGTNNSAYSISPAPPVPNFGIEDFGEIISDGGLPF